MKKVFAFFAAVLLTATLWAQSPEKISYQAVIRNSSNALVTNTQIGMEINIRQGTLSGTVVYTETQTPTTNVNGLVSIEIGGGTGFNSINWANGPYFIETKTAVIPPLTTYTITGTSQLLSVPYALHAKTAETVIGGITETDPIFTAWDKNYNDLTNKPTLFDGQYSSLTGLPTLFSGSYNDLTNRPTLFSGSFADLTSKPTSIAGYGITDAFSGNYNDLTNKPTLFDGQYSSLIGTPTFATVATSGSYNDLSNKPTIFDGNYNNLTNKPTLFDGNYQSLTNKPNIKDTVLTYGFSGNYYDLTNKPKSATYRWATFTTYEQSSGWACGNDASLFGGINPSSWTDNNYLAQFMSSDKEVLRTLFTQKGYAGKNAMIMNEDWMSYSSTNGKLVIVLFRIKNNTNADINWTPYFYYSAYDSWGERASVALNGVGVMNATSSGSTNLSLSIPANRVSTVIFVSTSGIPSGGMRNCRLVFYNNSLLLPTGLEFIDDLDTAQGGWEQ